MYLIALESLVLGPQESADIGYRLRIRCAHLLATEPGERQRVINEIKRLYGVRSKIVHSGNREVLDAELTKAREYACTAVLQVLHSRELRRPGTQLDEWFESRVLE